MYKKDGAISDPAVALWQFNSYLLSEHPPESNQPSERSGEEPDRKTDCLGAVPWKVPIDRAPIPVSPAAMSSRA